LESLDCTLQALLVAHMVGHTFDDHVQIARVGADHTARLGLQVAALPRPIVAGDKERCA
jgi:hypothetical protein